MTGQSLLNLMEVVDRELQVQSGEDDVTRALLALNAAQDWLETVLAGYPDIKGSSYGTVTTTASTETTAFPTGLLRVDQMHFVDPTTSLPSYELEIIRRRGGHRWASRWPFSLTSSPATGRPRAVWLNGSSFFWSPLPDATHTVRYYGFTRAADITAVGTFAYDDAFALPVSTFATRVLKIGLEDSTEDLAGLANALFVPAIRAADGYNRTGAQPHVYTFPHEA